MSTIKVDNIQTTSGVGVYPARAWVQYSMSGTASITSDSGVSSLTDQGTGNPAFNLDNAISSAHGSTWNTCGLYNSTSEYPVQSGAKVNTTGQWEAFCGSDTTTKVDWFLGSSGLFR